MTYLSVDLAVARGVLAVDVSFTAEPGEVLALLGPNGAGKSTVLQMISGLLTPDSGQLELAGRVLVGPGSAAVPVHARRISLMGQDPLLFPHLSATENVAFGPRAHGVPRARARQAAREALADMGLAELADRRPDRLSGGQRQRVALARALAAAPELLLLDEPLGALDVETAPEIRQLLLARIRQSGTTTILVTHDVLDAAVLADRVLVMDDGRLVDGGPTSTVLSAPRSVFSARMAGLNLLTGSVVETGAGTVTLQTAAGRQVTGMSEPGSGSAGLSIGAPAAAVFRPSAVALYSAEVAGSPRNRWPTTVRSLNPAADAIRVQTAADIAADLTPAAVAELGLVTGRPVHLAVKATEVRIYPH